MTIQDIFLQITLFLQNQDLILKVVLSLLLLLFTLFTLVFGRQVAILTTVVNQVTFSPIFKLFSYGLTIAAIILLVLVIIV